jgi:hypothetical protein
MIKPKVFSMEKSSKRGKIPQSDWPLIMTRYEAGETLASIARTYDCSPPAISYVVSKSRARQPTSDNREVTPNERESQLVKGVAGDPAEGGRAHPGELPPYASAGRRPEPVPAGSATGAPGRKELGAGPEPRYHREINGSVRDRFSERGAQSSQQKASADPGNPPGAAVGQASFVSGQKGAGLSPPSRSEPDQRHKLHLSLGSGTPGNNAASHNDPSEVVVPSPRASVEQHVAAGGHPARPLSARPS